MRLFDLADYAKSTEQRDGVGLTDHPTSVSLLRRVFDAGESRQSGEDCGQGGEDVAKGPDAARGIERLIGNAIERKFLTLLQRRHLAAHAIDDRVASLTVEAQIGGKLAQLGRRLVNGGAKKLADEFFKKFAASVSLPTE
jgi:hypothetical protein